MGATVRRALAASALGAATLHGAPAHADDKHACVAASEKAQVLRDQGKLKDARTELLVCARDACPLAVKKDCSGWLASVEASMPTIVLGAVDEGEHDLVQVRVSLDGQAIAESLDGKAILIDPGPHTLRFETAGRAPVEVPLLVREGEQRRIVTARFHAAGAEPTPPSGATRPFLVPSIVLGGLGIVALGSFAYLGATGKNELANLHATCGVTHTCAQSDVDATHTRLLAADVSLGVGIVALAAATGLFIVHVRTGNTSAAVHVEAFPVGHGAAAAVGGSF